MNRFTYVTLTNKDYKKDISEARSGGFLKAVGLINLYINSDTNTRHCIEMENQDITVFEKIKCIERSNDQLPS